MKQPMRARRKAMRAVATRSCARIDASHRALAYAMRKPRDHDTRRTWSYIAQHVKKTDGSRPGVRALQRIVKQWPRAAKTPGRKKGWRKTSPEDDKLILEKFRELRPHGHGIDARSLSAALPMPLKNRVRLLVSLPFLFALLTLEVCRRTCIRRLAEKGFTPQRACVCVWLCEWCVRVSVTPTALNRWILCKRKTRSSLKSRTGTWSVREFNNVAFQEERESNPGARREQRRAISARPSAPWSTASANDS